MESFIPYFLTGACTGVLSGLLGIGGGLIIVPMLALVFAAAGFPAAYVMQMALGTSLGTIIFTSFASARTHHRFRAVNWRLVRHITPGVIVGTLVGTWFAGKMPTDVLKILFVVYVFVAGTELLLDIRPRPTRTLPGRSVATVVGGGIGLLSSLVGIGGGTLSVPFMIFCNVSLRDAIGTSSAIGLPIALAGTAGYAFAGQALNGLPPYSLGFIYLPALVSVALASVVTAPLGAKLAHRLPVARLKKLFALLLYVIAAKMAWSLV